MGTIEEKLKKHFKQQSTLTIRQAVALEISRQKLSLQAKKGNLVRLSRGVYAVNEDILYDPIGSFVPILTRLPYGVICLISSLRHYELTDEAGEEKWIAIPNQKTPQSPPNVKLIRMRKMSYQTGIMPIRYNGFNLHIYDMEKTIIDAFRYLPKDVAIKALRAYLKRKDRNIEKLIAYGRKLRYDLSDIITALVTQ